jgi:hypothetical protein
MPPRLRLKKKRIGKAGQRLWLGAMHGRADPELRNSNSIGARNCRQTKIYILLNMKLIVYHQNAGQLENYCQRLTKGKNTVIIKTTLLKQLHRLLDFCQPK